MQLDVFVVKCVFGKNEELGPVMTGLFDGL
jgi:hypothetical protein